jgi:molybdenum cofactor cytidylyltransferase
VSTKLVGILLAAGYSRRFGADKLLARLADGTPIAVVAARVLRDGMARALGEPAQIVAVMRPEQKELAVLLGDEGIKVLVSEAAQHGMGASLAAAVTATPDAPGWVVALGDMPFLKPETVASVADALAGGAPLVAPVVAGQRGHPVGFAALFGSALRELDGDEGARQIIAGTTITLLPCEDIGALCDVDLPADLLE